MFSFFITDSSGFKIKCKHDHCNVEGSLENIGDHENLCVAREIICPMSFRGVCQFRGNLRDFLRHIKTTKCCQMLLYPGWKRDGDINEPFEKESVFTSHVGDNKEGNIISHIYQSPDQNTCKINQFHKFFGAFFSS